MKESKIDFIGIGAQKAGTTWLHSRLNELPEFSLLPIKELHYFDRNSEYSSASELKETHLIDRLKSRAWIKQVLITIFSRRTDLGLLKWYCRWFFLSYNDSWYKSLYSICNGLKGEITPSYSILKEKDVRRMYEIAPEAKLIFMLRNPIDRAWSQYRYYSRRISSFDINSLNITEIIEFINSDHQDLRSDYIRTIELYSNIFPKNQILIAFYDAISDNPEVLLSEIVDFIGGKRSHVSQYCTVSKKNNVSLDINIPSEICTLLKEKYHFQIKQLAKVYGGYCNKWYNDTYSKESTENNEMLPPTVVLEPRNQQTLDCC